MNKGFLKIFLLAVAIPVTILLSMTVLPLYTQAYGDEVLLETIPADPRDLFRGDHVVLRYVINEVDLDRMPAELRPKDDYYRYYNRKVYVVLKPAGEYFEVDRVTLEKPKGELYINGVLEYFRETVEPVREPEGKPIGEAMQPSIRKAVIRYNIDRYFVPENTGLELERLAQQGNLTAKVRVYNGYAVLIDITEKNNK